MAITSIGYDGTMGEGDWARAQPGIGHAPYGVDNGGLSPSITASTVPRVTISAGSAFGWGVYDTLDADTVVTLAAAPTTTGATRWDTIVLRRNWSGSGGTTTLVPLSGTSAMAVASSLNRTPGVLADQPICLAQVTAGSSVVTDLRDLRTMNLPSIWTLSQDDAYPDPDDFAYGQQMVLAQYGHTLVRRGSNTATPSTASWYNLDDPPWSNLNIGSGLTAANQGAPQYRVRRGIVELRGAADRANGAAWGPYTTRTEILIGTLPASLAPENQMTFAGAIGGDSGHQGPPVSRMYVTASGEIRLTVPSGGMALSTVFYDSIHFPVKAPTGL